MSEVDKAKHSATQYTPRISVTVCGREWTLERAADLDSLWDAMTEQEFTDDERLPYWTELWPSTLVLSEHLHENVARIRGKYCLDLGCGLGLSALVGASLGAKVLAMDYEPAALHFARINTEINNIAPQQAPLWTIMDWRFPAVKPHSIDFLWGGDIMYEKRFVEPVLQFLTHSLAKGGVAWVAEPGRSVYRVFQDALAERGWQAKLVRDQKTPALYEQECPVPVRLWELHL